jgi:hypothetical protein
MDQPARISPDPLGILLTRLRTVVEAQAEALGADDFAALARLSAERDQQVAALDGYTRADFRPEDRALLEQIGALDQRLLELARAGLADTTHGLRDVHRGRAALTEYARRGQTLIRNLAILDRQG